MRRTRHRPYPTERPLRGASRRQGQGLPGRSDRRPCKRGYRHLHRALRDGRPGLPHGRRGEVAAVSGAVDMIVTAEDVDTLARTVFGEARRSEEHTSELQSLMRISYAG